MEMIFKKFEALGRLINTAMCLYILVNDQGHKRKIKRIKNHRVPNLQYLQVDFLTQINYGCVDLEGKLVVTDQNQVYLHPNGSGDLWAHFEGRNYEKSGLNKFKYFQIFGLSNMLEHCYDCFMIGKLAAGKLPWITMGTYDLASKDTNPVIFVNHDMKVHVRDPEEIGPGMDANNLTYFPKKCPHIFLNNSVFSAQFIQDAISSPDWQEHRRYHCKRKTIAHRAPLTKYSSIFVFERQLTDIFSAPRGFIQSQRPGSSRKQASLNSKGTVVLMNSCQYFSSFLTKEDRIVGVVALSEMYKRWLKISVGKNDMNCEEKDKEYYEQRLKQICEIDPYISLEGENLEETVEEIMNSHLDYPFYIGSEEGEEFRITNTTMEENLGQRANQLTGQVRHLP